MKIAKLEKAHKLVGWSAAKPIASEKVSLPLYLQRRMRPAVRKVQLRDAKTNLSMIVDDAIDGKPTVIMRRGKKQAVVLSYDEWLPLSKVPSIARLLMASPLRAGDIPPRDRARSRKTNF